MVNEMQMDYDEQLLEQIEEDEMLRKKSPKI
jgi:hypothetical protein